MRRLSATEWAVYQATRDCVLGGTAGGVGDVSGRLPEFDPRTIQRARHRLINWGVIEPPADFKTRTGLGRKSEPYAGELTPGEMADVGKRAVEALERRVFILLTLSNQESSRLLKRDRDAIDMMADVKGEGREASRDTVAVWDHVFSS